MRLAHFARAPGAHRARTPLGGSRYGLGGHGVTYAGNQFMHNLLGFTQVFEGAPKVFEEEGALRRPAGGPEAASAASPTGSEGVAVGADDGSTPSIGVLGILAAGLVAVVLGRRSQRRN